MGSDMELDPMIDMESWKKISALSRECDQWRECAEHLAAALDRSGDRLLKVLARTPVRDVAETDAETKAALARFDALQEGG